MRKFQLSINLLYVDENNSSVVLDVYADGNNIWETICAGFSKLVGELEQTGGMTLPSVGVKSANGGGNVNDS